MNSTFTAFGDELYTFTAFGDEFNSRRMHINPRNASIPLSAKFFCLLNSSFRSLILFYRLSFSLRRFRPSVAGPKALVCCRRIISSRVVKTSPLPFSSVYLFNDSIVSAFPSVMSVTFSAYLSQPRRIPVPCQQPTTPIFTSTRVIPLLPMPFS
jgi:hypothetical protein